MQHSRNDFLTVGSNKERIMSWVTGGSKETLEKRVVANIFLAALAWVAAGALLSSACSAISILVDMLKSMNSARLNSQMGKCTK